MPYYNTNHEDGEVLRESKKRASRQEQAVIDAFRGRSCPLAPHEVRLIAFGNKVPLTSVRRAITDLTKEGFLVKTNIMVAGEYGKLVHSWRLAKPDGEQGSLF